MFIISSGFTVSKCEQFIIKESIVIVILVMTIDICHSLQVFV